MSITKEKLEFYLESDKKAQESINNAGELNCEFKRFFMVRRKLIEDLIKECE